MKQIGESHLLSLVNGSLWGKTLFTGSVLHVVAETVQKTINDEIHKWMKENKETSKRTFSMLSSSPTLTWKKLLA